MTTINRKMAFLFQDNNLFADAKKYIAEDCLLNHFSAALNGANAESVKLLLAALINGELEPLTQDDSLKTLWSSAGFKPEQLTPGTLTVLATGRLFGFSKSQRAISTGKVGSDSALAVKAYIWDVIGAGNVRHYNQREAVKAAIPVAVAPVEPTKPAIKPAKPATKPRQRKAAKVDQVAAAA